MKLETFIKDTLISIANGITNANRTFEDPHAFHLTSDNKRHIDFEISLVVEESKSRNVGGRVKVWVADVNAGGKGTSLDKHVHTVKFSLNASERTEFIRPRRSRRT